MSKRKSPNLPDPLQCRQAARWESGRGGESALGVKYDARTMRGMNDQVRWKKGDFFTSIMLVLMHELEG